MKQVLSQRETDVLHLIALSHAEISIMLGLSKNTVKSYIRNISNKLGANNRTEILLIALKKNLVSLDDLSLPK